MAFHNRRDGMHEAARALLRAHGAGPLVTTNHVRGETWTVLRGRAGQEIAVRFLDLLERSARASIFFVSEELEGEALRWLRRHDERAYSFVDATSFAVMRSLKVRDALTFDGDFTAAGFRTLQP